LSYISPLRLDFEEEPKNKVDYELVPCLRGEFLEGIAYDLRVERTWCMAGVSRECVGSKLRRGIARVPESAHVVTVTSPLSSRKSISFSQLELMEGEREG